MTFTVAEFVTDLIHHYDLHGRYDAPVDNVNLEPLENLFPMIRRDISVCGMDGYVIPPRGEITESNPAIITIDRRLGQMYSRLVYAHEIGHALYGHEGAFKMTDIDRRLIDREERDAWAVAARLLVPLEAVVRHQERARIAAACFVPEWLLDLV